MMGTTVIDRSAVVVRRRRVGVVATVCAALAIGGTVGPYPAPAAGAGNPIEASSIGRAAYEYGFPLLESLRVRREQSSVRCPDKAGNSPINSFSHADRFADPAARTVVAVNTDTLYSIAHLDLAKGPVVLRYPAMGKRYFSFAMLDPFTNVIATPGLREDGPGAAAVQIRWSKAPGPMSLRAAQQRFDRVVTSPSRRVWIIGRTLATDRADQRAAYALMKRYTLTLPSGAQRRFSPDCRPGKPAVFPTPTDGESFLAALNKALAANPPPRRDVPLLERLRPYGVGPGLRVTDAGLDPITLAALYQGVANAARSLPTTARAKALLGAARNDGWYNPPSNIGRYGTDYTDRAEIAYRGLGANTVEEATYPAGITDQLGVPYLSVNAYRMTFAKGQLPPARYFWSLTMYDADGYLVPNNANRYSLGPSHPPLVRRPDGSVVIHISRTDPGDDTVNWLPSPPGSFRLNLRLYGPKKSALDGTWNPPGVQNLGPRP